MRSGKSWLTAELLRTKSGYADWAVNPKTIWPAWSWERLGALAMVPDPKGSVKRSLLTLQDLADKRPGQPRRISEWFKSLRMLRMYGTVRTD